MKHFFISMAVLEGLLGVALFSAPETAAQVLLGIDISGGIAPMGRYAGLCFLALSFTWFFGRKDGHRGEAGGLFRSALVYNCLLVGVLVANGLKPHHVGIMLLPLIVAHIAMILWCAALIWNDRRLLNWDF